MRRKFRPTLDGFDGSRLEAKTLLNAPAPVGITMPLTPSGTPDNLGTLQGLTGAIVNGPGFPAVAVPSGPYHEVALSPGGQPLAVVPHDAVPYA